MSRAPLALVALLALAACGGSAPPAKTSEKTTPSAAASEPAPKAPPQEAASTTNPTAADPSPVTAAPTQASEAGEPKKIGARHVLIQYMGAERAPASVVRTREQARAVAEEVLRRSRGGEDLARLAVEYSDEPGAGSRGGSLGRFTRGQMVGAFEDTAFKLKVGEISGVVETPFGFHVIQRTE